MFEKILKWGFWIYLIGSVSLVAVMQYLGIPNNPLYSANAIEYQWDWDYYLKSGDSLIETGSLDLGQSVDAEEYIVEKKLPKAFAEGTSIYFRCFGVNLKFYIDGELRAQYKEEKVPIFYRETSLRSYMLPLRTEDKSKKLRIEVKNIKGNGSGKIDAVLYGTQVSIIKKLVLSRGPSVVIALLVLLIGIVCVLLSAMARLIYKKDVNIGFVGGFAICIAIWIVNQTALYHFLVPNLAAFSNLTYMMLMICPLPMIIYLDKLQNRRHHKLLYSMNVLVSLDLIVCTCLQFFAAVDIYQLLPVIHGVMMIGMCIAAVSIFLEYRSGYGKEILTVTIGLGILCIFGIIEILLTYCGTNIVSGTYVSIGMLIMMLFIMIRSAQEVIVNDRKHHQALADARTRADFLANMSHEIRTPINTIIGMNEMILRENKTPKILEYANDIESASRMLLALINDILDLSKIDSGKVELQEYNYELTSMLDGLILLIQKRVEKKNLKFNIRVDKYLPRVLMGDEVRVKQIFLNLLTNAVKYTERGEVCFSLSSKRCEDGQFFLVAKVSDTGIGICEEDLEKLFDKFVRLDMKRVRDVEGTGLGLAIVKELVQAMGGKINVDSTYGEGSVFCVELPQKVVMSEPIGNYKPEYKKPDEKTKYEEIFHAEKAKVLVVDDNEMNLKVVFGLLRKTKIQIDLVRSGQECLDAVKENQYNIILLDHMMPQMDGLQTLSKLRDMKDNMSSEAKVIALTANAIIGARERYLSYGFDDYLAKPVESQKLEQMVMKYLPEEMIELRTEKSDWEIKEALGDSDLIDHSLGMEYSAGDEELYKEIMQVYLEGGMEKISQLQNYFDLEDWENYIILIHSVKSNSLGIGASLLSDMAKKLEYAAKNGDYVIVKENHKKAMICYEKVLQEVEKWLSTYVMI